MAVFTNIVNGFAGEVDGIEITKMELPKSSYNFGTDGLWQQPIIGIIHHATGGCGSLNDLNNILINKQVSVHFGIDRDGGVAQYMSLERTARHAEEGDANWFALEHIASTKCNHTHKQLAMSVKVASALIHWVNDQNDPLVGHIQRIHSSGRPPWRGIADHIQGGAYWGNRRDGLNYAPAPEWNWTKYIDELLSEG